MYRNVALIPRGSGLFYPEPAGLRRAAPFYFDCYIVFNPASAPAQRLHKTAEASGQRSPRLIFRRLNQPSNSSQLAACPMNIFLICSLDKSSMGFSLFTITAIPSVAITIPVRPLSVSLCLSSREAMPISLLPSMASFMPEVESVSWS